jgi:hypothetical protein
MLSQLSKQVTVGANKATAKRVGLFYTIFPNAQNPNKIVYGREMPRIRNT